MRSTASITVTTASYGTRDDAMKDFDDVWSARHESGRQYTAIALLARDAAGSLCMERSKGTAKHVAWGGALLGGALVLLEPPVGVGVLTSVGLHGAGVIIAHFHDHLRSDDIALGAGVLEQGRYAVVVVTVVNPGVEDATPLLQRARRTSSMGVPWGELDEELGWDQPHRPVDTVLVRS